MTIDHARWQRLSPLLDQALDLAPEERGQWLDRLRRDNANLAGEVEALLEAARAVRDERFLEHTPESPQRATLAGQTLGAYTLEEPLGQGGMGSVWLARRSDGRFEGKVAIKFLNAALVGRAGEERFRREGSILARLTDPNIARLIDAGVSGAGQPYLVLELVDGKPHRPVLRRRALRCRGTARALPRRARRGRARARQPYRAPRPEAVERAGHQRRNGQAPRLRHREAARGRVASGRDRPS